MDKQVKKIGLTLFLVFIGLGGCSSGIGTSTGNPPSPQTTLTFVTTENSDSTESESALVKQSVTPNDLDHCEAAGSFETQQCTVTPEEYHMGVLAIYLVDCVDSNGASQACTEGAFVAVSDRLLLYEGDQVDLEITESQTSFTEELADISSDFTSGGIQIVVSYLGQKFPSATSNATEASLIMELLRGKTYRICTTPNAQVDSSLMQTRCGNSETTLGDYLVDLNEDGTFGFINTATFSGDLVEETSNRPTAYTNFNDSGFLSHEVTFVGIEGEDSPEYTSAEFYGTEDFFAPIFGFETTQTFSTSKNYDISVTLNITNTFEFIDGIDLRAANEDTCVAAISDTGCPDGDDDTGSVGIYNPFYDNAFLPQLPSVTATVEED